MKKRNVLRELLNEDKPSIAMHLHSIWPGMVEVIGLAGTMDYIEFSGEYAPYDLMSLENFGRSVDLFPNMSSMMKIEQQPRTYLAVRAVGSGIQNLLFADIWTADDAREAVSASRADTPRAGGRAGVGMRRDGGYGEATLTEYIDSLEDTVVALMIEKESAVQNLEEILSIGGIDMVQFGPADYSMSIGIPDQWDDPRIKEADRYIIETALKMGVAPRIELKDSSDAEEYIEMGVKHFCIGWDVSIISDWTKEHGAALAKKLGK
ncbi:MAG: aldolase/citrate lyase family protein [Chloroflexi bacterium]|nr:aldolase/citrate lyase family protein [Chloroflexota bacterium]MDA1226627.1 aldolase/citrate lyase family protein [Chloroflexota bacterium]